MADPAKKDADKVTDSKSADVTSTEESKEEEQVTTIEEGTFNFQLTQATDNLNADERPEILHNITVIGRAVTSMEPRFTTRVLRTLTATRKKLNKEVMRNILNEAYPKGCGSPMRVIVDEC
jgi:26S proteasome regulatory subunit N3